MRLKINGYVLQFMRADHEGQHIHVFKDNEQIGVYDRVHGPLRGLDKHMSKKLREAIQQFEQELNERKL